MAEPARRRPSLWLEQVDGALPSRPPLDGDADVDVAIVGAGYTGLWTAYALLANDPQLRVLLVERDHVGFGASGRNGGWCVGELAGHPPPGLARAIADTVDEVGRVTAVEGIDCGFVKGGVIRLARTEPQRRRQETEVGEWRALGFGSDDVRLLDTDEARQRLRATNVLGGLFFAPAARVQPARLAHGLAAAVERRGGRIVESTAVTDIVAGSATARPSLRTARGHVRADTVVVATEAYTRDLPGGRRRLAPVYSLMIATEPIAEERWADIGLAEREVFADDRRMVIYGQRTVDDRLAFGGRGAPYRFGSGIDPATEQSSRIHARIEETLRELLPALDGVEVTHRWGGVLGVPRDWRPGVGVDRETGIAWAGGYVGEGVAAANLAGRTLADLVTGADSDLTRMTWVGHRSRPWEPEPLRWLAINGVRLLAGWIDDREERSGTTPRLASALERLVR